MKLHRITGRSNWLLRATAETCTVSFGQSTEQFIRFEIANDFGVSDMQKLFDLRNRRDGTYKREMGRTHATFEKSK